MRSKKIIRQAWRQCFFDLQNAEWRALLIALFLATALASFLALLGNQLEKGLGRKSAEILGADLSLSGSKAVSPEVLQQAREYGLDYTEVIQFPSMLSYQDNMVLSSVRAVTEPYPLRGLIITQPDTSTMIPPAGTAWAEPQLLQRLGAESGSKIQLGYTSLTLTARLISSPDRGSGFRSFSPQLLINRADLAATRVIQPGSRVQHRVLFSGSTEAGLAFEKWLQPRLLPQQHFWSVHTDQPMAPGAMSNASRFLKLSSLFGLLLCGLLIGLSLQRYSQSQYDRCALLISLGLRPNQLLQLYLCQLIIGWAGSALLGTLAGCALLQLARNMLSGLIPTQLPPADPVYYLSGALLSFILMNIIGLTPLLRMSRVSVMRLLRHEKLPRSSTRWSAYLLLGGLIWGVLTIYLDSALSALAALLISATATLLAGTLAASVLLPIAQRAAQRFALGRLLRFRLHQQRNWHRLQLGIMSLLLALLSVLIVSRTELVSRWQAQLPQDIPNQFVINIQPWELQSVSEFLQHQGIKSRLYPMIRGRINTINNQLPSALLSPEQLQHNALHRELNLSWSSEPPPHNKILQGQWWSGTPAETEISIEQELAEELNLEIGDRISFDLAGQPFSAIISNTREVDWSSFHPNFYMILSPGALQQYPQTYITSFRLTAEQRSISNQLLQQFPALTLIDVDQIISQARHLIGQLIQASGVIMGLTLAAGLVLLQTLLRQELAQRRYENSILRVLGATPAQTRRLDLLEFGLLGLLSGVQGALIAELLIGFISSQLLNLPMILHPLMWLQLPVTGALLFAAGALFGSHRNTYSQLQRH
ncbi:MAG: FtsX-like permease family protein [Amphritea sp.]